MTYVWAFAYGLKPLIHYRDSHDSLSLGEKKRNSLVNSCICVDARLVAGYPDDWSSNRRDKLLDVNLNIYLWTSSVLT